MTHIDRSLGATHAATADQKVVLAALRLRRHGDRDTWASAAVLALLFSLGFLIALAGTTAHRVVLAAPAPLVAALGVAWLRQRHIAVRLHRGLLAGDWNALAETARFLDRPDEADARVSALRLASFLTLDDFESALLQLEATDAAEHPRPSSRTTKAQDITVTAYCVLVGLVVLGAWTVELRR